MGSWRAGISSVCYLIGTIPLVPGSFCFLPSYAKIYSLGVYFFIFACTFLTIGGLIDLVAVIYNYVIKKGELYLDEEIPLQGIVGVKKMQGGALFLVASVLYWPTLDPSYANKGTWVFRFGSISYIFGSLLTARGLMKTKRNVSFYMWMASVMQYIMGSSCYLIGGVLSQVKAPEFAEAWIVGSFLFVMGAVTGWVEVIRSW